MLDTAPEERFDRLTRLVSQRLGEADKAIEVLQAVARARPKDAFVWMNLGVLLRDNLLMGNGGGTVCVDPAGAHRAVEESRRDGANGRRRRRAARRRIVVIDAAVAITAAAAIHLDFAV